MLNTYRTGFRVLFLILICLLLVPSVDVSLLKAQSRTNQCVQFYTIDYVEMAPEVVKSKQFDVERGSFLPDTILIPPITSEYSSYSPDGRYVNFVAYNGEEVYIASVETRKTTLLYKLSRKIGGRYFPSDEHGYWSPNSKYLAFTKRGDSSSPNTNIILNLETEEQTKVPFPKNFDGAIIGWSSDSNYLAFSAWDSNEDIIQLFVLTLADMKFVATNLGSINLANQRSPESWSPTGRNLAYLSEKGELSIWSPEHGVAVQVPQSTVDVPKLNWSPDRRFGLASITAAYDFRWSPDAQYITITNPYPNFEYSRSAYFDLDPLNEIFRVSDGEVITFPRQYNTQIAALWTEDNWLTLFDFDQNSLESTLARVNITTNERQIISILGRYPDDVHYRLSTTGRYMAYIAQNHEVSEVAIETSYSLAVYDAQAKTLKVLLAKLSNEMYTPAENSTADYYHSNIYWSPDESYLATAWQSAELTEGSHLVITERNSGKQHTITTTDHWVWLGNNWLYYVMPEMGQYSHELINVQTAETVSITKTSAAPDSDNLQPVSLSSDGRFAAALIDNELHIVSLGEPAQSITNLFPISQNKGDSRSLIGVDQRLAWSPDNSMVTYIADTDLVVATSDGKELHRVPLEQTEIRDLSWVPCQN